MKCALTRRIFHVSPSGPTPRTNDRHLEIKSGYTGQVTLVFDECGGNRSVSMTCSVEEGELYRAGEIYHFASPPESPAEA